MVVVMVVVFGVVKVVFFFRVISGAEGVIFFAAGAAGRSAAKGMSFVDVEVVVLIDVVLVFVGRKIVMSVHLVEGGMIAFVEMVDWMLVVMRVFMRVMLFF